MNVFEECDHFVLVNDLDGEYSEREFDFLEHVLFAEIINKKSG